MLSPDEHAIKGRMGPQEQRDLLVHIGTRILEDAPAGWSRLTYRVHTVVEHGTSELIV